MPALISSIFLNNLFSVKTCLSCFFKAQYLQQLWLIMMVTNGLMYVGQNMCNMSMESIEHAH